MAADVTLQIRLNGGGVQTGGITAAVGDTCQLTALSKTGWEAALVKWEIYAYPPAFTVPAGWSTAPDGSFYVLGSADPPAFTMDEWGKYLTRVTAANQSPDERTAVDIPSPNGLHDIMRREGAQFGGQRLQWTADQQENLRVIDAGLSGSGSGTVAPTANQLLLRGASGEGKVTALETDAITSASGIIGIGDSGHTDLSIKAIDMHLSADALTLDDVSGTGFIGLTLAAAGSMQLKDTLTSWTLGWQQRAAGAGKNTFISGQQGQAGFAGGALNLSGGAGGTPGTNLAGNILLEVGQAVSNATAKVRVTSNLGAIFEMSQTAASTFTLASSQMALVVAPADRSTAGVGYAATFAGGKGNSSNIGGDVRVSVGAGATPGTNAPGNMLLDMGRTVGGTSGVLRIVTNAGGADVVRRHIDCLSGGINDWTENETLDLYALALQLRSSNGVTISSTLSIANALRLTGVISPAAIGTNQTDYSPAGLLAAARLRQDVSAACLINSMAAGVDGQEIEICNISATAANTLTLRHDDGTGTAAQRFLCPNNANVIIRANGSVRVRYDGTSARWRVLAI